MKTIYILLITFFVSTVSSKAQTGNYPGTWHAQNGNTLFIVSLWQEGEDIYGHYKMVEYNNNIIGSTIFKSNRILPNGVVLPFTISTNLTPDYVLSGFFYDNTIQGNPDLYRRGNINIRLAPNVIIGCNNCTIQATWKVSPTGGMYSSPILPFSVPTDVILTKVSNTINLD